MASKMAARKFSFGAPQEVLGRVQRQDTKKSDAESSVFIESKPVILLGKRQSAMRPGSIPSNPPQR
jgi:hypothetical protein